MPAPKLHYRRPHGSFLTVSPTASRVLALIAQGRTNTEIAAELYVAETTVKTHVNRIFAKTRSRDRMQAAVYAQQHGLAGEAKA